MTDLGQFCDRPSVFSFRPLLQYISLQVLLLHLVKCHLFLVYIASLHGSLVNLVASVFESYSFGNVEAPGFGTVASY